MFVLIPFFDPNIISKGFWGEWVMGLNERVFFLRKARESERLAATLPDEQDRSVWQEIAHEYFKLAEENGENRHR